MADRKLKDVTAKAWLADRPEAFADADKDMRRALEAFETFAGQSVDEIIAANGVSDAEKATGKLVKEINDLGKLAKKEKDRKARKALEEFVSEFLAPVEAFEEALGDAVDSGGHPPEFLALRARYDEALRDDIKRTTQGPKPYLLVFRDFAGKKDAFLTLVFRTGRVKPSQVTELERSMRDVFGQSWRRAEGVVRKEGTVFVFEYPADVELPEKLRKQMKLELGMKVEFEAVATLSEVVTDADGTDGPAEDSAAPSTGTATDTGTDTGTGTATDTAADVETLVAAAMEAIDRFEAASEAVDRQISELQLALQGTDDPELRKIADSGLAQITSGHKTKLRTGILEFRGAAGDQRPKAGGKLGTSAARFADFLLGDERVEAVDENPFGITVTVRELLGTALADLATATEELARTSG